MAGPKTKTRARPARRSRHARQKAALNAAVMAKLEHLAALLRARAAARDQDQAQVQAQVQAQGDPEPPA